MSDRIIEGSFLSVVLNECVKALKEMCMAQAESWQKAQSGHWSHFLVRKRRGSHSGPRVRLWGNRQVGGILNPSEWVDFSLNVRSSAHSEVECFQMNKQCSFFLGGGIWSRGGEKRTGLVV